LGAAYQVQIYLFIAMSFFDWPIIKCSQMLNRYSPHQKGEGICKGSTLHGLDFDKAHDQGQNLPNIKRWVDLFFM
jgi:hypothetical protein